MPITNFSKQRKPSALMLQRQKILDRLEKLVGDDVTAGVHTPWKNVVAELRRMRTPELNSLVYRVERAVTDAEQNAVKFEATRGQGEES
jgi:hypothetical protein